MEMEQLSVMQKIPKFKLLYYLIEIRGLNLHLSTPGKMFYETFGLLIQNLSG